MANYKTLENEIGNSPYFIKDPGLAFSQILFKPGYPLQSAELITLQNIINEQIRRFGRHIFKEGSIVHLEKGLSSESECLLFELDDLAQGIKVKNGDRITFRVNGTNLLNSFGSADFTAVELKNSFIDQDDGGNNIVYPNLLAIEENVAFPDPGPGVTVEVYVGYGAGTLLGTLLQNQPKIGRFCSIGNGTFFVGGYFTNIAEQSMIYWYDDQREINCELGVQLTWEIADISHPTFGQFLFDPAENAFNENSPGADRLILKLELARKPLGYNQLESDWKFIPLVKYQENKLIYRIKYPIYAELGETLARRTYEINGNFVVDEFRMETVEDAALKGIHQISNRNVITPNEEIYWTINGQGTNYKDKLEVGNYLLFGDSIRYNRLLRIEQIDDNYNMIVSDIHYDDYDDEVTGEQTLQQMWDYSNPFEISLRDESKLNYTIFEGLAYVKGWRYEKEFITKLRDNKARETKIVPETVSPNRHYFVLNYDEHGSFIPNQYINTEHFIDFERLEEVDLHCTENKEYYELDITDFGFNSWLPGYYTEDHLVEIDNAAFRCVETGTHKYEILKYTKNELTGIPKDTRVHTMKRTVGLTNYTAQYELDRIEKTLETPYTIDAPSNYMPSISSTNKANTTFDVTKSIVEFSRTSGRYDLDFANNDFVVISNSTFSTFGQVANTLPLTATNIEIRTFPGLFEDGGDYQITKPSEEDYHNYQYNSTKIGTIRSNSVSSNHPDRFYFSHFNLFKGDVTNAFVFKVENTNEVTVLDLRISFASDVYNNMTLTHASQEWPITDYNGDTQTFTLGNVTLSNPINFSQGAVIGIRAEFKDVRSIVKTRYPDGKEFKANIRRDMIDYPMVKTPNGTQQKFRLLLNEGEGEVKSVMVDSNAYDIFRQHLLTAGSQTDTFHINLTTANVANNNLGTKTQVYAADDIPDPANLSNILYAKGENIPIDSSIISGGNLTLVLRKEIPVGSKIIVHLEVTVQQPQLRTKDLQEAYEDRFDVDVDTATGLFSTSSRNQSLRSFELTHSDIYRVRKIEIAAGKSVVGLGAGQAVDMTHYFDLDTGQRETHYDHGRINLKPNLELPSIVGGSSVYGFIVTYDYFKPSAGHYFTVNSYKDIHYRKIPTFVDPTNKKFPLRNVIDFRPVRQPAGSTFEYDQEVDFTSDSIDLEYEYYLNEEKIISIEGNGSTEIEVQFADKKNHTESDYHIKLYDVKIPAYTFDFNDVEYKMIDNRNFEMSDIARLQKRIENLEDIAQLNSLELQTIQTKLVNSNGDPRYKNGMIVDMFAGFNVADIDEPGFAASIDLYNMKMHPKFTSTNFPLKLVSTVSSAFPTVNRNIAHLPITSFKEIGSHVQTHGSANQIKLSAEFFWYRDGILTLHPFSESWYSQNIPAQPNTNDDNQYKNWNVLQADAHGTQWSEWDHYIFGQETEDSTVTVLNATLSQKTGLMVNNKNNIEKVINRRKINTTLNYYSKNIRVGYVFQRASSVTSQHHATDIYRIELGHSDTAIIPSQHEGMRLYFKHSGTLTEAKFKALYQGFAITQTIAGTGIANGIIQHIIKDTTVATNHYYLYVTNIDVHKFVAGSLNELNGSIDDVHDFSNQLVDNEFHVICGDFEIGEKDYPLNSVIDVRIVNPGNSTVEGSSKFYMSALIETMTSHCQSIRPAVKKLYNHDHESSYAPYIDDRTYKINSSIPIPTRLHQPFVVDHSMFLTSVLIQCKNDSSDIQRFTVAIQPIVNDYVSPSIVLPFSEVRVDVPANFDGIKDVRFDIPVFVTSNKDYAVVIFSNTGRNSDVLKFYTESSWNNSTVFYTDCYTVSNTGVPQQQTDTKLSIKLYHAVFDTTKTYEMFLHMKDPMTAVHADLSRLNMSTLNLADTDIRYYWKARNYDSLVQDAVSAPVLANKTIIHDKRKIFSQLDYETVVHMKSSNPYFTPMIDLERASILPIEHEINNGALKQKLISGNGTRTGAFTGDLRLIATEQPHSTLTDYDYNTSRQASFRFDLTGTISDMYSDPNFLVYNDRLSFEVEKWSSANAIFEADSTATTTYNSTSDSYTIIGDQYEIKNLRVINEFDHEEVGNPDYRYYSPIVTLADDFEAMQLYVQMDAILKRSGEIFVYYRTLESSSALEELRNKRFTRMEFKTHPADKYSNNNRSKTIEFETNRTGQRFKYFQVKVCFTSSNFIEVPIIENIRILALDN